MSDDRISFGRELIAPDAVPGVEERLHQPDGPGDGGPYRHAGGGHERAVDERERQQTPGARTSP